MDREPSKLLDEAAELIAKASADTAGQAAQRASQATTVSPVSNIHLMLPTITLV